MKYAFYISGKGTRLLRYLTTFENKKKRDIGLVISDRMLDDILKNQLHKLSIPAIVFEYKKLPGKVCKEKNQELSNKILEALENNNIDYCFSFGTHILSGPLLKKYENRLINFHPAILPMYPGMASIDQAVEAGNTFLVGNTVHFIDEGVDTGKIIMQSAVPLEVFFPSSNYDAILDLQIEMLHQVIMVLEEKRLVIRDGRVKILGADYRKSTIYPFISDIQCKIIEEESEKIRFILKCNRAFGESICNCENGPAWIRKLCQFSVITGVYCNGNISAYCAMYVNDKKTQQAYISMFAVYPDYQKLGIGQRLMNECVDFAKRQRMRSIKLEVRDENISAIRFYEKNGYIFSGKRGSENSRYMIRTL